MTSTISTVTIKIMPHKQRICDIEEVVGHSRIYQKGTDDYFFADVYGREQADLLVLRLNMLPSVHAEIWEHF